jgi:hypothetical protein
MVVRRVWRWQAVAFVSLFFAGAFQPIARAAEAAAPAELSGLSILYKSDSRMIGGTYAAPRWLIGPTFASVVQPGAMGIVDVKVRGLDATGKLMPVTPDWTVADPDRITVTPGRAGEFRITVSKAGESTLRVRSHGVYADLLVKSKDLGDATQVEITEVASGGPSPGKTSQPVPESAGSAHPAALLPDQHARDSYSMGVEMGRRLSATAPGLDPDLVSRGLRDAMSGEAIALTDAEIRTALVALRRELRARQLEGQE